MAAATDPTTPPGRASGEDAGRVLSMALAVGLPAGTLAGAVMAAMLIAIGEIASEPTAVAGIDSSTWTPLTGIASFVFGLDAFHGDFALLPIVAGLALHMALALLFGVLGVWFILVTQGDRVGVIGGSIQGVAYALFLQVYFLNLVVGAIQEVHTVYESIPRWGWWVGHGAYGATLGAMTSVLVGGGRTVE